MPAFIDQLKRKIEIPFPPKRIISLVPSQTELLYDLGLRDEVVGITKFCVHPEEWFRSKARVGGTKKYDFDKIKALQPDLIIGNKEENEKEQIEELMKLYPVWMSDIYTLKDALAMIVSIGSLTGKSAEAINLKLDIESRFNKFKQFQIPDFKSDVKSFDDEFGKKEVQSANVNTYSTSSPNTRLQTPDLTTAYFIWRKPYMVAGHDTFINEMLNLCGMENVFTEKTSRYPEVSIAEIIEKKPEVILLSSEPYPFKEQHVKEFSEMLPDAKIKIVDGEIFSWYGSRLLKAPGYFSELVKELRSDL
ncbi:MAG: cobalamin-binding protein [Bacteroidota bacterium]|jgi:ABC-type Fe3+-hydroxamate transport system substrate-binding protein|nr:cobalamin-binding protein [Bacteroidota bacterium]